MSLLLGSFFLIFGSRNTYVWFFDIVFGFISCGFVFVDLLVCSGFVLCLMFCFVFVSGMESSELSGAIV